MKILNKNGKLKYSKMFIDLDTYKKICEKYDTSLEDHIKRMELYQKQNIDTPEPEDVMIMYDVYSHITRVIRPRR